MNLCTVWYDPFFWQFISVKNITTHEMLEIHSLQLQSGHFFHQIFRQVLDALLAEATEGRPSLREFLSSWEQQWRDLLEKRQELRDLEAAAASSMENSEARHMPLAETLDADWAQWSNGGVSEIERLIEEFLGDAIWIGNMQLYKENDPLPESNAAALSYCTFHCARVFPC